MTEQNRLRQMYELYSPENLKEIDSVVEKYPRKGLGFRV